MDKSLKRFPGNWRRVSLIQISSRWFRESGAWLCCEPPYTGTAAPHTQAPAQSEAGGEWDVANPPRCHIWHSNPSIVLHSDLRACAIPNCDWRLWRSQLLATLHWTVLPENFSANCGRINQRKKLHCVSFLYVRRKFVIDKVFFVVVFFQLKFLVLK